MGFALKGKGGVAPTTHRDSNLSSLPSLPLIRRTPNPTLPGFSGYKAESKAAGLIDLCDL